MLLKNKNVIIYGAAGSIGAAVAKAYATEGARVFLTGRTRETLDKLAAEITSTGGKAEADVVDALDEQSVDEHARSVVELAGSIDVSLNLVPRGDAQGIPLVEMTVEDLARAVTNGITSNFLTARAAGRQMIEQKSGVILALNSGSANGSPGMGSTGPADAALDTFIRNLAREIGPSGVRALGIWVAGIPETLTLEKVQEVNPAFDQAGLDGLHGQLAAARLLQKSPSLEEVANLLTFLASDQTALTGVFVNYTGMFTS